MFASLASGAGSHGKPSRQTSMRLAQRRHWTVVGGLDDDEWSFSRIGPSLTHRRRQPEPWRMPGKMAFGSAHCRAICLESRR